MGGSLLVLAVLLAGCHQPDRIDMKRGTRRIAASLSDTYDLPVDHVICPTKVAVDSGSTFECTVRISGQPLGVRVIQRNAKGDLRVEPEAAVLVMAKVRTELKETLSAQLGKKDLKAGCGAAQVRIVAPGRSFECKVADARSSRNVTVRVRDATGNLSFTLH